VRRFVGDAEPLHLLAQRASGLFEAELDQAAPQERERRSPLRGALLEHLEVLHGSLGAAMAREEPAELVSTGRIVRTRAQGDLERARAVRGAAGELEAPGCAAGVAGGGERCAGLEVRAEPREERAGLLAKAAGSEVRGGAEASIVGQGLRDGVEGVGGELVVAAERGEVRGAARIACEQRLARGADEVASL